VVQLLCPVIFSSSAARLDNATSALELQHQKQLSEKKTTQNFCSLLIQAVSVLYQQRQS